MDEQFESLIGLIHRFGYVKAVKTSEYELSILTTVVEISSINKKVTLEENGLSTKITLTSYCDEESKDDISSVTTIRFNGLEIFYKAFSEKMMDQGYIKVVPLDSYEVIYIIKDTLLNYCQSDLVKLKFESTFEEMLNHVLYSENVIDDINHTVTPVKYHWITAEVLTELKSSRKELNWIPYEELKYYSFISICELKDFLENCSTYLHYNNLIKDEFGYELVLEENNQHLYLSCKNV